MFVNKIIRLRPLQGFSHKSLSSSPHSALPQRLYKLSTKTINLPLRTFSFVSTNNNIHSVDGKSLTPELLDLGNKILNGDRVSLSRAITLVESNLPTHRHDANLLLAYVLAQTKLRDQNNTEEPLVTKLKNEASANPTQTTTTSEDTSKQTNNNEKPLPQLTPKRFRIGISGPPGVGKSTFIEEFGSYLISKLSIPIAVLSIDPSSRRSGGSILGDKTRMNRLNASKYSYIRPSPSRGVLGGVGAATLDALTLVEGAGYKISLVETVGVGQSEVAVADMVDMLILLVSPGGGDELQGIKKGIVECADMIIVNKADGEMAAAARHTKVDYMHAVQMMPSLAPMGVASWKPKVTICSSLPGGDPVHHPEIWGIITEYAQFMMDQGRLEDKRRTQRVHCMWQYLYTLFIDSINRNQNAQLSVRRAESDAANDLLPPRVAAEVLLSNLFNDNVNSK